MDWIGNLFIVLGLWGIGDKRRGAFVLSMIGEGCWIVFSLRSGLYSLALICVVFFGMAARSWWKWGRSEVGRDTAA